MKRSLLAVLLLVLTFNFSHVFSQVGIGTATPNQKAVLELKSPGNNQGFLVPRLTTTQRTGMAGLSTAEKGLLVFDSDISKFYYWNGSAWIVIDDSTGTDNQTLSFNPVTGLLTITGGNNVTVSGTIPGGSAGGDLTGTYPNPAVANNAVTSAKLQSDATTDANRAVTVNHLRDNAVTSAKISDGTIVVNDLADGSVTSAKVLDGAITNNDINASAAIAATKLAPGTNGQVLLTTGTTPTWSNMPAASGAAGGDLTGTYPNPTIANDAIISVKILNGAITTAKIANTAVDVLKLADGAVNSTKILDGTIATADILDGAINTLKIADNGVTSIKISDGAITNTKILDGAITSAKILDGTIATGDILDGTVGNLDIGNGAITNGKVADNAINSIKIADGSVATIDLLDGAITNAKIATGIDISKLAAAPTDGFFLTTVLGNVTWSAFPVLGLGTVTSVSTGAGLTGGPILTSGTISLADNGVTSIKILDGAVSSADIANGTIATADVADLAVTTLKVADDAITSAKLQDDATTDGNRAVTTNHIRDAAVNSAKITDATIVNADVSTSAAVAVSKLAAGTTGNVLTTPASGIPTWQAPADASATNELQSLSITGTTLSISSGNSVTLPGGGSQDLGSVLSVGGDAKSGEAYNLKSVSINSGVGKGALNVTGSQFVSFTAMSGSYTVKPDDYLLIATTGKPTNVELPKASDNVGRILIIRTMAQSAAEKCVVSSSEGIDGSANSEDLYLANDNPYSITVVSVGSTWLTINRAITPAAK